ncbi:PAS domain-containing protein [Cytobacillus oceanisediminis]|uniref:histidine kinase n=1 Tax=Cytobacillus oceanisediminis 2691 TaxID=1196031 RepID=A0A160MB20_9BACI|nr:PAS domain-containing protein [Cytobacillus oceanisediminis]AND39990.1 PAS domain-containing sensor histidine kinase [Cytobacillus oceanisediminis 2691]
MTEIIESFNPILIFVAVILTIMASYTALDLFTLIKPSERNQKFLFLGGTFSLGIGIWIMNFIGMIAININASGSYNIPLTLLSMIFGISFTGMAFNRVIDRQLKTGNLFAGSFFLTMAVLSIHVTGMFAVGMNVQFSPSIFLISALIIFVSFLFSLWMLFYSKSLSYSRPIWIKPLSALIFTGAIVEGYFLLIRSSSFYSNGEISRGGSPETSLIYLVFFAGILILSGLIASSTLISKRLEASDTHLHDIQAALDESSIVAITDPKGVITYVNDKFVEISKYEEHELLGKNHNILNSGFHPPEFFQDLWKTIGSGEIWKGEIRNKAKDGSFYWVDTTIVPFLNKKNKPYQYVSIRTDISALKSAAASLKSSLKDVNDIKFALDQSSIIAFTDEKGTITNVNEMFCEISQYSREELIGQNHSILNSGLHSKEFFKNLWKTIGQGEVWKGEIRNKAKDGSYYWVHTTIVPFLNANGKPYQYLSIRNDITERKKTEEVLHQQDKLAAVGQLAAGVAHEIRNPLTTMKGYTEFLQLEETHEERQEYLSIILDEIDRVNNIVEDFMVLAKPKAAELKERDIIPIIKNVVSFLEFEARNRNVKIGFEYQQDIIQIECDENRLKQVLLNFIKNGIEAMPDGGNITVRAGIINNQVQIAIKDTGVGIPQEKLKNIGEPFFTTKKNGNGLGLMVSFKIIESHNGKVFIESELNKGTTFNIVLPAKSA